MIPLALSVGSGRLKTSSVTHWLVQRVLMDSQPMPQLRLQLRNAYAHRVIFWTGTLALPVLRTLSKMSSATPRSVLCAGTIVSLGLGQQKKFNASASLGGTSLVVCVWNVPLDPQNPTLATTLAHPALPTPLCRTLTVQRLNACRARQMSPRTVMMVGLNVPVWLDSNSRVCVTRPAGQTHSTIHTVADVKSSLALIQMKMTMEWPDYSVRRTERVTTTAMLLA